MNRLSSGSRHSMITRIITAAVLIVVLVPCLLLGGWYFAAAIFLMALISIYEFVSAPNKGRFNILIYLTAYIMTLSFIFWNFFSSEEMTKALIHSNLFIVDRLSLSPVSIIVYFGLLFMIVLLSRKFTVSDATYLFTMGVYVGLSYLCILFLRFVPNSAAYYQKEGLASSLLADYVVIGVIFNDIGAYFTGVTFGTHKMAPRISPHKTWEGFAGGVVASIILSYGFAYLVDCLGYPLLPGTLDFADGWWRILLISLVMPLAGDFGDLLFSSIKRYFAIKDFGSLLPGHGGVLDRIDSLSFAALTTTVMIVFFIGNGLWFFS